MDIDRENAKRMMIKKSLTTATLRIRSLCLPWERVSLIMAIVVEGDVAVARIPKSKENANTVGAVISENKGNMDLATKPNRMNPPTITTV